MKKVLNSCIAFAAATVAYVLLDIATSGFISKGIVGYISIAGTVVAAILLSDFLDKHSKKD